MDLVTIADVRKARLRDEEGVLVNTNAFNRLAAQWVRLYDPPIDGRTPLDGAGDPSVSTIPASQALGALDKGFTEEPHVSHKRR